MRKEIRTVDSEKGIMCVTTVDERWYARAVTDQKTGLPTGFEFVPSVTWICGVGYVKGVAFYKWLANTGWDESQAIKVAAGDRGSKVHQAVADLLDGRMVAIDAPYTNPTTGQKEELTLEEYEGVVAFRDWWAAAAPELIAREFVVWGDGYAGTVDLLCRIGGVPHLIDLKTGQHTWPEHELQVSAYKHALPPQWAEPPPALAILQVGYRLNKRRWKLTPVEDQFPLFLAARQIWQKECEGVTVFKRDYPLAVALGAVPEKSAPRAESEAEP